MPDIDTDSNLKDILKQVAVSRESAGEEEKTRKLIDQALTILHDTAVALYLEKCGVWQHVQMTERDKPEKSRNKAALKKSLEE